MCADPRMQLYSSRRDQIHPIATTVHEAKWRARPNRYLEATGVPELNAQSPSELRWRLRVKSRPICGFDNMMDLKHPFSLIGSGSRRTSTGEPDPPSKVDAHGRPAERSRRYQ
jgi:hypothetical protein